MITPHPAIQQNVRWVRRSGINLRVEKRIANRRHRRYLNSVTKSFERDPEKFYAEDFGAPTLTDFDLD